MWNFKTVQQKRLTRTRLRFLFSRNCFLIAMKTIGDEPRSWRPSKDVMCTGTGYLIYFMFPWIRSQLRGRHFESVPVLVHVFFGLHFYLLSGGTHLIINTGVLHKYTRGLYVINYVRNVSAREMLYYIFSIHHFLFLRSLFQETKEINASVKNLDSERCCVLNEERGLTTESS